MVNTTLHIQQQPMFSTPPNPQQPMVNTTLHIQQQPMFSTPPNPPATNG